MITDLLGWAVPTFTAYYAAAILLSVGIVGAALWGQLPPRVVGDVCVATVVCGFVGARGEYVLLNLEVFAGGWAQVLDMNTGGLDWHGALLGGAAGLWLAARAHQTDARDVLPALAPALPLLAFAGWTACRPVGCVYGAEVPTLALYPAWLVTEGRDIYGALAPRYDTHTYGQALAWGLGAVVALRWTRHTPSGAALTWGVAAAFCAGMFAIGFFRADITPTLGPLRADQWLDAALFAVAVTAWTRSRRGPTQSTR